MGLLTWELAWLLLPIILLISIIKHKDIFINHSNASALISLREQSMHIEDYIQNSSAEIRKRENEQDFQLRLLIQIADNTSAAAFYLLAVLVVLALILLRLS